MISVMSLFHQIRLVPDDWSHRHIRLCLRTSLPQRVQDLIYSFVIGRPVKKLNYIYPAPFGSRIHPEWPKCRGTASGW